MLHVQGVINNSKNQALFRHVARETTGESYQPPEGDRLFLASLNQHGRKETIGAASYTRANRTQTTPSAEFLSDYYHNLNYIFIKGYFQGKGHGSRFLQQVEKDMAAFAERPVRLQSATDAVKFFEKHGYCVVGDPIDCSVAGSSKFKTLFNMEKELVKR